MRAGLPGQSNSKLHEHERRKRQIPTETHLPRMFCRSEARDTTVEHMNSDELRQFFIQQPFKPFNVTLVSGEQVEVRRPWQATYFKPTAVFEVDAGEGGQRRMRIVPINEILSVKAA